ncbi:hypothetical protein E3Q11_03451 [Wallemia mellicola]|nr:hypothetical protein E3Q11_03451 [Wallemia mellicola]
MKSNLILNLILLASTSLSETFKNSSIISQVPSYSVQFTRRTFVTPDEVNDILKAGEISIDEYTQEVSHPLVVADVALREPIIPIDSIEPCTPHIFTLYPNFSFMCLVPSNKMSKPIVAPEPQVPNIQDVSKLLDRIREDCVLYQPGEQFHAKLTPVVSDDLQQYAWKTEFDTNSSSYILGRSPVDNSKNISETKELSANQDNSPADPPLKFQSNGFQKYITEEWKDGQICDRTGDPRSTTIEYYCLPGLKQPKVVSIQEITTCNYVMQIQLDQLCEIPVFNDLKIKEDVRAIQCIPILENGSKWPDLLVEEDLGYDDYNDDNKLESPDANELINNEKLESLSREDLISIIARAQLQ